MASTFLQATRQIAAISQLTEKSSFDSINNLERAMGVLQHHDAISGTEKQPVANDYSKRLAIGIEKSFKNVIKTSFNFQNDSNFVYCSLLNISDCVLVDNLSEFGIYIYNPLAKQVDAWIRIPVVDETYRVHDENSTDLIPSEILLINEKTQKIPERTSRAQFNLVFKANLPPLNLKCFLISKETSPLKKVNKVTEGIIILNINPSSILNSVIK